MLLTAVPELHKKWQHVPLEPAARSANGAGAGIADVISSGAPATTLARAAIIDELAHAEQVVERDLRYLGSFRRTFLGYRGRSRGGGPYPRRPRSFSSKVRVGSLWVAGFDTLHRRGQVAPRPCDQWGIG